MLTTPTPHIAAKPGDFGKTVLMPGDPLRSKFIAENFLENPVLVNNVRGVQGTISVSPFIPKPFTPFQWEAQDSLETMLRKQAYVGECIRDKRVRYTHHDARVCRIEAVLARGDRRLSKAMAKAHEKGFVFDAWTEFFDYDKWIEVFEETGIDPSFYANRAYGLDEVLPWDIIDCGVTKAFLLRERARAYEEKTTPS